MSDDDGIILGTTLSVGIIAATFLLSYVCYKIGVKCRERNAQQSDQSSQESQDQPSPVNDDYVRPQRSQYSEVTLRFFEEFGINGYQRDPEADRQIEVARQARVIPNDVLPEYHEVADSNLPTYHEAVNVVNNSSTYRVENERY